MRKAMCRKQEKRALHSSQQKQRGDKHYLERKIAALKDAETRSDMELNKPLKIFAAKDYQKKTTT